jgi:hypothetical protein
MNTNTITITTNDTNYETVLTILNNLKEGLITNIESKINTKYQRKSSYQPNSNKVVFEQSASTVLETSKYASASAYKNRLKKT